MISRYHFIGVGGIGVGTLASLMLSKGHTVSGSDVRENDMTRSLEEQGARILIGHAEGNVSGADCVIYSSAIRPDNPELEAAHRLGIPILKRAELLAELMKDQIGITVAGAHGKTTTTSMIANLLLKSRKDPTVALGGVFKDGSYRANLGGGRYFVAEVDESDGTFLFFYPKYSVITNIDYEHLDHYGNWTRILEAFGTFIGQTQPDGRVIVCGEDRKLRDLAASAGRPFMTYGFSELNDVFADNVRFQGCLSRFDVHIKGGPSGTMQLLIPGQHNILNALACVCVAQCLDLGLEPVAESFRFFQGVDRRFQIKGRINDIVVVDDYGHHPTEITATLEAAKAMESKRMITVFQPHRYSRTKFLMEEFVHCLAPCEYLIVTDIYPASEPPLPGINAKALCERIASRSTGRVLYLRKEEIVEHLLKIAVAGDMILTLGAGDIYRLGEEFLKALSADQSAYAVHKKDPAA